MVGVGAGAGAGFGVGAASVGAGAVFAVGAAAVGAGAAAFTVNTGENCGGPVFFDGFVFCRAFLPVAWSFASRSRRAGEPLLILVDGDAAFLPGGVGRGIGSLSCDCCGCPRLATPLLVRIPKSETILVCLTTNNHASAHLRALCYRISAASHQCYSLSVHL